MKKAIRLAEIDAAVNKFMPVTPEHPFYVDFKDLRGDFQERKVMKILNVSINPEGRVLFRSQGQPLQ
jgi:aspartate/methionine/tyrosine aminotransferase